MRRIFSTLRKITAIIFSRVIMKKPSKFVEFTKIDQTLRNTYLTWPKRSRIKFVVPSNSLKQENVCLIPRESEHPSSWHCVQSLPLLLNRVLGVYWVRVKYYAVLIDKLTDKSVLNDLIKLTSILFIFSEATYTKKIL